MPEPNETKPIWYRIAGQGGKLGESARAYECANAYFSMGAERSLSKLIQKRSESGLKTPVISCLKRWSAKWNWVERAAAYDQFCFDEREREMQKARIEQARRWIERDENLREEFYQVGQEIVTKARRMIRGFPEREVSKKTSDDGQTIHITIKPKHSLSGLAQLISVGAELQRIAVGINPGSSPLDKEDFMSWSSEDLRQLQAGLPVKPMEAPDGQQ
ncbi:MAG: hypothetical protein JST85_22915 [Acidobacteria bacterium]|nr:hypothetical protein [Acidobacteriota bacterium]